MQENTDQLEMQAEIAKKHRKRVASIWTEVETNGNSNDEEKEK